MYLGLSASVPWVSLETPSDLQGNHHFLTSLPKPISTSFWSRLLRWQHSGLPWWSRSALAQNTGNWTHLAKHLIEGPQSAQNSVKHCGKFGAAEKNKADTMQSQGIMRVRESLAHTARRQLWRRKWEFVLNSSRPFFLPLLCLFACLRDRVSLCSPGWTST